MIDGDSYDGTEEEAEGSGPPHGVCGAAADGLPGQGSGVEAEDAATDHGGSANGVGCPPEGERDRASGHVYLIGTLDGCHKIGKSNNVGRRIPEIGAKLPVELRVIHAIPTTDMTWLESYIHMAFDHQRTRGEWFRLSSEEISILTATSFAHTPNDLPRPLVVLHDSNWFRLHPPRVERESMPSNPRKDKPVCVELPVELLADVKEFAEKRGERFREVVVAALRRHLAYPPSPLPPPEPLPDAEPNPKKGKK